MGWGEEIDFSSVCVVETVFLLLLALNIAFVVVMVMYQNRQMIVLSAVVVGIVGAPPRIPTVRVPPTAGGKW